MLWLCNPNNYLFCPVHSVQGIRSSNTIRGSKTAWPGGTSHSSAGGYGVRSSGEACPAVHCRPQDCGGARDEHVLHHSRGHQQGQGGLGGAENAVSLYV